ncbi:hypothetical protein BDN71DRAFT_446821 [Pleurotus eryngii]|uniref:Uncharacterized protein n=1 Tax=Pleurotus eryngii TaxID=5323 RepID=A0A9P6DHM7_PLEER|nr:hypothetical protein BDN71DRAFT_446821 [Pleurotus eryngii]
MSMSRNCCYSFAPHRYNSGGPKTQILLAKDRIKSNEGLGIWHVGIYAWKVYSTTSQLQKLKDDYQRADVKGLPMGKPRFTQGTVQQGSGRATDGFALIVNWVDGSPFNFQQPPRPFRKALETQNISHSKSDKDYTRVKGGCQSAENVGLQDCQGFVKQGAGEPLIFIDVHTSWNPQTQKYGFSQQAVDMVTDITNWGTSL